MAKVTIGVISAVVTLAIIVEWGAFESTVVLRTIFLGGGAFLGFYAAEIAKKAVRARQISHQVWAYVVSFDLLKRISPIGESFGIDSAQWAAAIADGKISRVDLDTQFLTKISQELHTAERIARFQRILELQRSIPGRITHLVSKLVSLQDEIDKWGRSLTDEDLSLLGPEILFEAITFRVSLARMSEHANDLLIYIRDSDDVKYGTMRYSREMFVFFYLRALVSLERLKALVDASRASGLLQHSMALLG